MPALHSVGELGKCLAGQTVVIASAGPSLAECAPLLARRKGGCVVAPLQSLGQLKASGARADFSILTDPRDYLPYLLGYEDGEPAARRRMRAAERRTLAALGFPAVFGRSVETE